MTRRSWQVFLLALVIMFAPSEAMGCTCMTPNARTMRDLVGYYSAGKNASRAIFEGMVAKQELVDTPMGVPADAMSMTGSGQHRLVTVRVLRTYREEIGKTVTVVTGLGEGDCGFDFETGKKYLIYANRTPADSFSTDICSGTTALEEAGPALRLLRGEAPTAEDLMDPESYYKKVAPRWWGTACGRVKREDGGPAGGISIEMTQVRDEPFPPKSASDPNTSKADGSFCVIGISAGKYVLTGETDFDHDLRWMGYYPGVTTRAEAAVLDIEAGIKRQDLNFVLHKQRLYTVSFRIVASDGSALPLDALAVMIDGPDRDDLNYHLVQNVRDGEYTMGYVPPGKYRVRTVPTFVESDALRKEVLKWRMANEEVEINSDVDIPLKLESANK